MSVTTSHPGVFVEEIKTTVRVVPGVSTAPSQVTPSGLLSAGYKIVETQIDPGGLAILFGKETDHILVRMVDYREGNSTDGRMAVTFVGKLP
jgi:hypothetical protein